MTARIIDGKAIAADLRAPGTVLADPELLIMSAESSVYAPSNLR